MKFKELRQKKNILQKDIAKFLGITPATYSRYENGIMEPSYDIVIKQADFFNVSTDYILGRDDTDPLLVQSRIEFQKSETQKISDELSKSIKAQLISYARFLLSNEKTK